MAWTTPKTWASGYVVLAADLNTHLRDNLNVTAPAVMSSQGDVIYASGANTPARLAKDANATRSLTNTGSSNNPAWAQVALATGVSGTLPIGSGGTGATTLTANGAVIGNGSSALTSIDMSTKGGLLVGDGTGNPSVLAVGGTANYVLKVDSGETTGMKWAVGGGDVVLIGTVVASNDATITVTGLDSTYDAYLVIGSDLVPASDGAQMQIRLGDSSGVDSGGSDYEWWRVTSGTGNTDWSPVESTSDTDMQISGGGVGNDTDESGSFMLWLPLPGDTDSKHFIYGNSVTLTQTTTLQSTEFLGSRLVAITCDRIQFLFSSGHVTSGRMTVWGLAHA